MKDGWAVLLLLALLAVGCTEDGRLYSQTGSTGWGSLKEFQTSDRSRSNNGRIPNDGEKHISEFEIVSEIIDGLTDQNGRAW